MSKNIVFLILLTSCILTSPIAAQTDHTNWNSLLQKHVSPEGKVNYNGFLSEKNKLNQYLTKLTLDSPTGNSSDKLAHWINAYNAYTVKLIIDHYPIASIKDIAAKVGSATPWDYAFANVGGQTYTLNQIEHEIIRSKFNEPLIHFAVNCAAKSCPILRNEAYKGSKLKTQLNEQAKIFLSDSSKNKIMPNRAQISQIFNWFKDDFTKDGSLVSFLNIYSNTKLKESAHFTFIEYEWTLNN